MHLAKPMEKNWFFDFTPLSPRGEKTGMGVVFTNLRHPSPYPLPQGERENGVALPSA